MAVDYLLSRVGGVQRAWERVRQLAEALRSGLVAEGAAALHDHGRVLCGIVSFTKASRWGRSRPLTGAAPAFLATGWLGRPHLVLPQEGCCAEEVRRHLAGRRINVSVSRIGSTRTDFEARGLDEVVRASVHYYNTREEVDALVRAVAEL